MINVKKIRPTNGSTEGFTVTQQALEDGRAIGISGDIGLRLARMARRSSPLTHSQGNRRFDDFVLMVRDKQVLAVDRL